MPAIDALIVQAKASKDPYFIGLVAGILYNVKRNDEAATFADQVYLTYVHAHHHSSM